MTGVLVDSDVLIEVLRGRKPTVIDQWNDLANSGQAVCYSTVSLAEMRHGMRGSESQVVARLFSALTCLPIAEEVGRQAGDYLREFHKATP